MKRIFMQRKGTDNFQVTFGRLLVAKFLCKNPTEVMGRASNLSAPAALLVVKAGCCVVVMLLRRVFRA